MRWSFSILMHPAVGVYLTPILLAAGIYFAITGPDWWHDFFFDHAFGFLITAWIGAGFAFMWWQVKQTAWSMPGGEATAAVVGVAGVVLVAGFAVFSDPWFFGVAVWPGLSLLVRAVEKRLSQRPTEARGIGEE